MKIQKIQLLLGCVRDHASTCFDESNGSQELLEMLDICALAWKGEPSEEFLGSILWFWCGDQSDGLPSGVIAKAKSVQSDVEECLRNNAPCFLCGD